LLSIKIKTVSDHHSQTGGKGTVFGWFTAFLKKNNFKLIRVYSLKTVRLPLGKDSLNTLETKTDLMLEV